MHQEIEGSESSSQSQKQPGGADRDVEEHLEDADYVCWAGSKQGETSLTN